jgi:hypothetical protein
MDAECRNCDCHAKPSKKRVSCSALRLLLATPDLTSTRSGAHS